MIVQKIESINTLSRDNAQSLDEIVIASQDLNSMTEKLNVTLGTFKT